LRKVFPDFRYDISRIFAYRSSETLPELARAIGLEPEQHIITYCGVGISASLALFALYLAGYLYWLLRTSVAESAKPMG